MVPSILPLRDVCLCLDGRMLSNGGTGVSTYARNLRCAHRAMTMRSWTLEANRARDGRVRRLFGALRHREHRVRATGGLTGGAGSYVARDIFRRAHIHFSLFGKPLVVALPGARGLMHWTYPVPMVAEGWANVYTIHDAIPLVSPNLSPIDPRRHRAVIAALAASAARFVTVSTSARDEIVDATGLDSGRIVDCGQPVDVLGAAAAVLPAGLTRDGYLLVCGAIEPRKNLQRLIAAYRASGLDRRLVFVGPPGWRSDAILREIDATPQAMLLDYQDRAMVLRLISDARALLMPSLSEGFGLPMAEAMALGTPVMTSSAGALAEVAGGAAMLVDPTDTSAMADAMRHLDKGDDLRRNLRVKGLLRAKSFTMERFAGRLADVYRDTLDAR